MKFHTLVWKEMIRRPGQAGIALFVVALGVSALVAVDSVVSSSETKIAGQMRQLGANILILPDGVTLQDYHAADSHGKSMPEEYVARIAFAQKVGVEELAPKLSVACTLKEKPVVLTGILPRTEFYKKSAWQSAELIAAGLNESGIGRKHEGCQGKACQIATGDKTDLQSYASTRVVHQLDENAALIGCDLARQLHVEPGQRIEVMGDKLLVAGVLPATGTTDDGRVFAHLHKVQALADAGPIVNVIEVMGCCEEAASDLVTELDELLPEARVVTISQIVETQVTVNRLMSRLSYVLFGIVMLIGGASIARVRFANGTERRRELGTLMALGATPGMVSQMILLKASTIGFLGGLLGLVLGLLTALIVGPRLLGLAIGFSPTSMVLSLLAACGVALIASYLPARRAAHLDPCVCFQQA
ncbi:MAG: FtsX-like permease family protein [Planctomycetota bacterium]